MAAKFDQSARVALAAIVADADLGPDALSDPGAVLNLLSDYLPSSPREIGLLMAAAQADVAGTLREHVAHGMHAATAIRITASSLASRTAYSAEACVWVTGELAIAIGLTTADRLPELAPPSQRTDVGGRLVRQGGQAMTDQPPVMSFPPPPLAERETEGPQPAQVPRVRRKRGPLVAAVAIVVLVAAAGSVALYYARNRSGGTPITTGGPVHRVPRVSIGSFAGRRPNVIDFRADGASAVTGIRWSTWSGSLATGSGTWDHETCVPSCATGPVRKYPATLTFSQASHGLFTVLKTRWDGQASTWRYPNSWPQEASVAPVLTARSTPRQVVEAYIAAINQHNWPRVWRLGGKNLNASYNQMVAGYRHTGHVVIQTLTTNGRTVTARTKAYETTGAVQTYLLTYKVSGGVIVAGSSNLLGTSGQSGGQWTASKLVITPHSLGAVTVGMSLAQASAAAGVQIVEVGDGFGYPSGKSSTGLAIAGPPDDPVTCVVADAASAGPNVVTPEGFLLGGTAEALKSLYGSRLRFVPAPATGFNPVPGYVVSFPDGNLAFIVHNGLVTAIIGGKKAMPSTC